MTDEEKKKLAERVAAQGDAGGSSTNGRLSAPNTNSAMTGLRTGEDLEKGYSRHAVLEDGASVGGGVGVSQTPVDGTQTIPQEIPEGSTVVTMPDGNRGVVTPQGQTLVPNAEEYNVPSVQNSPVMPMNTAGAIQPVDMSQVNSEQEREQSLRGRTPVDNTQGVNTDGEYWKVAPKEEVKAQPSQTEKQERVIPDYMKSEQFQKGLDESLEMGGKTEEELKGENDRAKRLDNALLSDYDDSSLLLQEYAKGLISPEEEERRARRARAAEGWAHIGNIISGFAGLANTKKGSPNIDLADVKDAKVDEWRDKVRTNRNTYDKMRVQLEHQRNLAKWRDANLREKIRMNDIKVKQAETEQDYKKALLTLKEIEADYKQAMVDLQAAKTRAIANKDEREERYLEARLQELQEKINATRKLAEEREARANNIRNGLPANGGSSGSGTSKPVVVGGKEVANPRKLNQGDVNRHIKAVAKNNGIAMTKRGNGLDEKDKTIDELGEEIAGKPKALQELRDRLANGESGGNTNGTKKALPGANKPASGKKKLPGK